jgi:uncharacterized membrane protein YedE/YeeE
MPLTAAIALLGGVLVGLAAAMLLATDGRIAGVSGIVGGLLRPTRGDLGWRIAFVLGLAAGGALLRIGSPGIVAVSAACSWQALVVAGLLVGCGSQMANGCTSGHGVCGIGRGSLRSIVAAAVFMATGGVAAYVVGHVVTGYR